MRKALRQADTTWTSEGQRQAVMATLQCQTDVVAVLATGAGKTMTAIVPALIESNHTTVVVVPLKALLNDYVRRFNTMNIPFQVFSVSDQQARGITGKTNLILTLVDQARRPEWKEAIARVHHVRPIKRIVLDEVHLLLTNNHFRPSLENLYELRRFPCQFVLLSGTVPPQSLPILKRECQLIPNFITIRTNTVRAEHRYVLERPMSWPHIVARTVHLVNLVTNNEFKDEDRGLIYVNTKSELSDIQKQLECLQYCGGDEMTDGARASNYQRWIKGRDNKNKWMVVTSAFSAGNDYGHVRCVIFAGTPICYSDFQQSAGRAGRDRREALVVIIPDPVDKYKVRESSPNGPLGQQALIDMVYLKNPSIDQCVQRHNTAYMDGTEGLRCKDIAGCFPCSRCEKINLDDDGWVMDKATVTKHVNALISSNANSVAAGDAKKMFEEAARLAKESADHRVNTDNSYAGMLHRMLLDNTGKCPMCLLLDRRHSSWHELTTCPAMRGKNHMSEFGTMISSMRYPKVAKELKRVCFYCHVPQLNDMIHPTFVAQDRGQSCQFKDRLIGLMYGLWRNDGHRYMLQEYIGRSWPNVTTFGKWLVEKPEGEHRTNIVKVFVWWCTIYKENVDKE